MKGRIRIFILLACGISGCAGHYYSIEKDVLHLYLLKPEAGSVYFASSLDGFELHGVKKIDDKTWEVQLPAKREFKYFYVVDDVVFLPPCRFTEADDFGSKNCIFIPGM
ncbi:MAG: hypothetical protein JW882_01460 [Deltaproteobacteria bacterium]|nr:hypothetical protein [Deltaproteobacteria bacterium]